MFDGVGDGVGDDVGDDVRGKLLIGCRYFRGDVCIDGWDDGWIVR